MAALKNEYVEPNETTTQQVSMMGSIRNILVEQSLKNERSLSKEIVYRVKESLRQEGLLEDI